MGRWNDFVQQVVRMGEKCVYRTELPEGEVVCEECARGEEELRNGGLCGRYFICSTATAAAAYLIQPVEV